MKIIQNEFISCHLIYSSHGSINYICELRISTNCRFPFRGGRGGPSENDHEFPFAGDVELLGRSLTYLTCSQLKNTVVYEADRASNSPLVL